MASATASTSLVPVQPVFTESERLALAGFLAGYRGLTREASTLDLAAVHQLVPLPFSAALAVPRSATEAIARRCPGSDRDPPIWRGRCAPGAMATLLPDGMICALGAS